MKFTFILILLSLPLQINAQCRVKRSDGTLVTSNRDALFVTLNRLARCPTRVQDFKTALESGGLKLTPSMVANRGFHNPDAGSFSFFETVTGRTLGGKVVADGDFFLGHFTAEVNGVLILDQAPEKGKLLIELIVKNFDNGVYHFYEMIGTANSAEWFYRGDSIDVLKDNRWLYRTPPAGVAKFGNRLRCSGCHSSGGPILKEIARPHNDWWTKARRLPFGKNRPSAELVSWMQNLRETGELAESVKKGIAALNESTHYRAARRELSLPERLRPLFCENEINLESDLNPLEEEGEKIMIPSAFLLNPLLGEVAVTVDKARYLRKVAAAGLNFPETERSDADHAWLVPVKGLSDLAEIKKLVSEGTVDLEFVADVLAIDSENPVFSQKRCELLKLIPEAEGNWKERFQENLLNSPAPAARELLNNLTDATRNETFHQRVAVERAQRFDLDVAFAALLQRRAAAFRSEISQNPRGQILEPGFRVVFPQPNP